MQQSKRKCKFYTVSGKKKEKETKCGISRASELKQQDDWVWSWATLLIIKFCNRHPQHAARRSGEKNSSAATEIDAANYLPYSACCNILFISSPYILS